MYYTINMALILFKTVNGKTESVIWNMGEPLKVNPKHFTEITITGNEFAYIKSIYNIPNIQDCGVTISNHATVYEIIKTFKKSTRLYVRLFNKLNNKASYILDCFGLVFMHTMVICAYYILNIRDLIQLILLSITSSYFIILVFCLAFNKNGNKEKEIKEESKEQDSRYRI